jgi:four helix bundle protein
MKSEDIEKLAERLLDLTIRIIKLVNALPNTPVGKHVGGQLLRCGTSPGSNYEEAQGAESKADFIHKLSIVLKELKETRYWLRVILRSELLSVNLVNPIIQECEELCAIFARSIITTKQKK